VTALANQIVVKLVVGDIGNKLMTEN